jgi:hypothetical protein
VRYLSGRNNRDTQMLLILRRNQFVPAGGAKIKIDMTGD